MIHLDDLLAGLTVLRNYNEQEVNLGWNKDLYAGPDDVEYEQYGPSECITLEERGWEFNKDLNRWGISA